MKARTMLTKWILRKLAVRCWGVELDRYMPPEFVITEHATQRLAERDPTSGAYEPESLVVRAWYEGMRLPPGRAQLNLVDQERLTRKPKYYEYRELAGFVYVFVLDWQPRAAYTQKKVVTVLRYIPQLWNLENID